jgi:hypothetical protein
MSQKVLDLIKIAKKYGLRKVKCDGIELEFGEEPTKAAPRGRYVPKELSPTDEMKAKEEQMANMMIEDPLKYEELMMS